MTKAKLIIAVLTSRTGLWGEILASFKGIIGAVDFMGPWHTFTHTSYYEPEMGPGLKRCIVSFDKLISPDKIPELKSFTKEIEDKFRMDGKRSVNLDPGYVDLHKVILASGKGGGHMILIGNGVYADVLLWYNKGWQPMPWAYPDFKDGTYFDELNKIRGLLKGAVSISHQ